MKVWQNNHQQQKIKPINIILIISWLIAIISYLLAYTIAFPEMILSFTSSIWAISYGLHHKGNIYRGTKILWYLYIMMIIILPSM